MLLGLKVYTIVTDKVAVTEDCTIAAAIDVVATVAVDRKVCVPI